MRPPVCTPVGSELHCAVTAWVQRLHAELAVTDQAQWWVSEAPFSQVAVTTPIAEITSPGVVTPRQHAAVYVNAAYSDGAYRGVAPVAHSYLIDPANAPIVLAPYVTGNVTETGGTAVVGAVAEIIDGPDSGNRDVTRVGGTYFLNHVHMSAPFTVRVSYPGFETVEKVHEGIFDNAAGYAFSPPLNFVLSKK